MRARETRLLTILFQFIDIQIKKYVALTKMGVGPDAGINADLVLAEANDLLELAQEFITEAEKGELAEAIVGKTFSTMKFYLELEDLRVTASELIDANNIHNTAYGRVQHQLRELAQLDLHPAPFKATTPSQQQCEHDSHAIANLILNCALVLDHNPKAKLPDEILDHASRIMRKNAVQGRYKLPAFRHEIERGHQHTQAFLAESKLEKSKTVLSKAAAEENASAHQTRLKSLFTRFDHLVGPGEQSSRIPWYEIRVLRKSDGSEPAPRFKFIDRPTQKKRPSCRASCSFFKAVAWTAALGVTAVSFVALANR